nr:acyl carrier protein [Clostridium sp. CM74B_53]
MEKIKIKGSSKSYEIRSIQTIEPHVMQIVFVGTPPTKWGDITLYTDGGIECATLTGWTTVYRDEGQTVYLSDDDSVYQTPDPDTGGEILPPEPYVPTLEELQEAKKQEVNAACNKTIVEGFDVELSDGQIHHFTMKEEDQIAFLTCLALISKGETAIPWHPNGSSTQPCVFYSTDDMQKITDAAYEHRTFHTTYCNSLKIWVEATETAEELQEIYYGADVPETYQSDVLKAYLKAKESVGGTDESEAVR